MLIFQSTLSARRATFVPMVYPKFGLFQSTLSARRATENTYIKEFVINISIHALREESDPPNLLFGAFKLRFQSTLSARRATIDVELPPNAQEISIHALREESDFCIYTVCKMIYSISIHALREESDAQVYSLLI